MGWIANRRAEKAKRDAAGARLRASLRESYTHPVFGVDPAAGALLLSTYTQEAPPVDHDEDVSDNADDTGREDNAVDDTEAVDTYDSEIDRYV